MDPCQVVNLGLRGHLKVAAGDLQLSGKFLVFSILFRSFPLYFSSPFKHISQRFPLNIYKRIKQLSQIDYSVHRRGGETIVFESARNEMRRVSVSYFCCDNIHFLITILVYSLQLILYSGTKLPTLCLLLWAYLLNHVLALQLSTILLLLAFPTLLNIA